LLAKGEIKNLGCPVKRNTAESEMSLLLSFTSQDSGQGAAVGGGRHNNAKRKYLQHIYLPLKATRTFNIILLIIRICCVTVPWTRRHLRGWVHVVSLKNGSSTAGWHRKSILFSLMLLY